MAAEPLKSAQEATQERPIIFGLAMPVKVSGLHWTLDLIGFRGHSPSALIMAQEQLHRLHALDNTLTDLKSQIEEEKKRLPNFVANTANRKKLQDQQADKLKHL